MDNSRYFHAYDEESDRIHGDDEMNIIPERESDRSIPMNEEEARSYSSVYDLPVSSEHKKSNRPKQ